MKGIFLSIIILIGCLCFSACSEQNTNENSTSPFISSDSSNENAAHDSDSEAVLSNTTDGSQIESHISASDTNEEQSSDTSQNNEEYHRIDASFRWGGQVKLNKEISFFLVQQIGRSMTAELI